MAELEGVKASVAKDVQQRKCYVIADTKAEEIHGGVLIKMFHII